MEEDRAQYPPLCETLPPRVSARGIGVSCMGILAQPRRLVVRQSAVLGVSSFVPDRINLEHPLDQAAIQLRGGPFAITGGVLPLRRIHAPLERSR